MKNVYEGRDFSILVSNEQKGLNYLIHVKDKDSNSILRTIQLPQTDTFWCGAIRFSAARYSLVRTALWAIGMVKVTTWWLWFGIGGFGYLASMRVSAHMIRCEHCWKTGNSIGKTKRAPYADTLFSNVNVTIAKPLTIKIWCSFVFAMVEHRRFELLTPTLPVLCATNCANAPHSTIDILSRFFSFVKS